MRTDLIKSDWWGWSKSVEVVQYELDHGLWHDIFSKNRTNIQRTHSLIFQKKENIFRKVFRFIQNFWWGKKIFPFDFRGKKVKSLEFFFWFSILFCQLVNYVNTCYETFPPQVSDHTLNFYWLFLFIFFVSLCALKFPYRRSDTVFCLA